jgi:hypothetical protein
VTTLPSIIGLWSPAAGCGKSTVAGILIEAGGHRIEPFAGTLKRMLVSMLQDAGLIQSEALGWSGSTSWSRSAA